MHFYKMNHHVTIIKMKKQNITNTPAPPFTVGVNTSPWRNHLSGFCHHWFLLAAFHLYLSGIIWCVLFVSGSFSSTL